MRRRTFLSGMAGAVLAPSLRLWAAEDPLGTIAFIQRDGLWIQSLPAGKPARLFSGAKIHSPRFSPSGQWISYFEDGVAGVVSRDGKQNTKLGIVDIQWWMGRDELLVESPLGTTLYSAANGWTGAAKTVRAHLPVLFSPDGKQIVYSDAVVNGRGPGGEPMRTGRLYSAEVEGVGREPVVLVSKYLSAQIPCTWSRNGEYVLYWEDPDFSASVAADGLELFRVPAAGGSPQSMAVSTLLDDDLRALSPAQDKLAVTAGGGREEWEKKRIAVIDLDTAAISYVTDYVTDESTVAVCPSWSPDGRQLAYSAAAASTESLDGITARRFLAKRRIWAADVVGTREPRQLTSDDRYRDEEPMWSVDGQYILFCRMLVQSDDDHDNKTLWLMEAGGSRPVQIAELFPDPRPLSDTWFGYYGHIAWRKMFDWFRGPG